MRVKAGHLLAPVLFLGFVCAAEAQQPSTFSIVAYDPQSGALGVAAQSKFPAVGALVPWAKAGVGAIATQAAANLEYGEEGLRLLASGLSAEEVVRRLTEKDPGREERQVGIVDAHGGAAAWATGGSISASTTTRTRSAN